MSDFEYEIKVTFLAEAQDLLANTEKCFLCLESNPADIENLNLIFRLAHNLKGSSAVAGFADLASFTHHLESLLLALKEGRSAVTRTIIDLLLRTSDYLIQTIEALTANHDTRYTNPLLMEELIQAMNADGSNPAACNTDTISTSSSQFEIFSTFGNEKPGQACNVPTLPGTPSPPAKSKEENIRVSLARIESLLNNVGELSILQAVMVQQGLGAGASLPQLMRTTMSAMSKIIKETQNISMGLRMLPIKQVFHKMERIVRDTSNALEKDVRIHLSGEETEVDKTILEQLSDPLVHMVRNSVDHGIEDTAGRAQAGKPTTGNVYLSAFHRASQIVIEVRDDGKGLDAEKLVQRAKEKGLIPQDANLTAEEAHQLIFAPGFSTKEAVTDISGRGVGMDVVKTNIAALQGQLSIETTKGQGTCIRILLPLTLAIIDSVIISVGKDRYVVPLSQVSEFFRPKEANINNACERSEILTIRNETLPAFRLANLIDRPENRQTVSWDLTAIVVRDSSSKKSFALLVDRIVAQQQVVIKPLGKEVKGRVGIMGSAILGDGKPALILDLVELVKSVVGNEKTNIAKTKVGA
jgi:two-component system chemotaxis sensor kinase CheA